MPQRSSYENSVRTLQKSQLIDVGDVPLIPQQRPRHDDEVMGVSFFRTELVDAKLDHLTLPRTFFGRSEIRATSFRDTDLSESTANWNDFIEVDFTGANLSGSDMRACVFERVKFRGATLMGVDFRYCGFKQCDFTEADLTDVKLTQRVGAALRLTPEQQSVVDWHAEDGEEPEGG